MHAGFVARGERHRAGGQGQEAAQTGGDAHAVRTTIAHAGMNVCLHTGAYNILCIGVRLHVGVGYAGMRVCVCVCVYVCVYACTCLLGCIICSCMLFMHMYTS